MVVLKFVPRREESRTVEVLRAMVDRAERGEVLGVEILYRDHLGHEALVISGYFKDHPAEALRSCLQAGVLLNEISEGDADLTATG